ncbi:lytic transglycosylase domain-containing protein [Neorhizobium galegae]|uniref:lytic transglycosylase domain-containing protein n=1 Tax=Neorhizobium galegae TaxID=399 RepID=UPI0006224189|nr:lytic transglycosylase domain-containing protein [Neorhizobium galegae]CDZ25636.1 Lytic transglycosylase catalytic [Neorhizobium galegae bv. officinalis]KAA9387507.1 lytic transglycosylase domain-containing protein [Neorhizobium galegae]KAB1114641.1 lytic transglycosylase domain-containing protein [Neorhizobium galegae]MCM2499245.1 lytic transglycosylase domain-containing protein [Neorhizobium galegae]MCQ1772647.1 lytic transglycosylase domain-containing protein [Neorhizobium galegae]
MNTMIVAAAAGLAMLVAGTELVRAEDDAVTTYTKPLVIPWETRETGFAAPTDEARRLVRQLHYSQLISKYADEYDVPEELALAVVQIESNFRPTAKGSAGEIGLMQIKPATARLMGYRGPDYGLYDPETNIRFGMKYLAGAHELGGGKICGTILRYNAGHGAKRMNPVSKRYCNRVQAVIETAEQSTEQTASLSPVAF